MFGRLRFVCVLGTKNPRNPRPSSADRKAEESANIRSGNGAEQGIGQGVEEHVAIGVPPKPLDAAT